ncbi:MAG TPA: phytanoyl-CoA dioxygenase family protein [Aestuariivirgaceae bacterium]|nr:phytanoyl-CoA dioxygenase family protein [Aestuariivirgaceae bacterium]
MTPAYVSHDQQSAYRRDGAVVIPGLFRDWVDVIAAGIERNMREPGPYASENLKPGDSGRFFDDYCNWERIPEFVDVVRRSPAARAAAELMGSTTARIFHDHVLVKEPGTSKATPWHQDAPYYFVGGEQTLSFWIPVEPVREATLRLIAGSHLWPKFVLPTRWLSEQNFYAGEHDYLPVPDPDAEPGRYRVLEWALEPGDAVAFHYKTVHGARGNLSDRRRRAFSIRWLGDDARYVSRPGRTSPPYPGHGMKDGETLRDDWFPVIWRGA